MPAQPAGLHRELLPSARAEPAELPVDGSQHSRQHGSREGVPGRSTCVPVALHAVHAGPLPGRRPV